MPDKVDGRSSEEIRRSIEHTRSQLDETVDTLEARLAPRKLMNQALDRIRGRGDDLGGRIGDTVRDHPLPLALVAVGMGWLILDEVRGRSGSSRRSRHEIEAGTQEPAEGRRGPYGPDAVNQEDPDWEFSSRKARVKAKARNLRHKAGGATRGARKVQGRFSRFIDENPLAVGAIAFGLGLASAMSVPPSEREARLAGRASERVKERAKEMGREVRGDLEEVGREASERATRVAEDAARAAKEDMAAASPEHETASQRHPRTGAHGTFTQETVQPGSRRPETRPSGQQPPRGP